MESKNMNDNELKSYLNKIVEEEQNEWQSKNLFEAKPDNRKKFFVNLAYPYINGFLHLGHLFSFMRVEVMARYKRMKGYNVLFPQGLHATGQPIVAAAKRVKEKEPKQIEILKLMGIPDKEIPKFENPEHWIEYFSKEAIKDLKKLGASIDFRRTFITTELNPAYDKFIQWQYLKLKEKNYIQKGTHPVVWCPNCQQPLGDHDRAEGEGITPEEVVLIKFKSEDNEIFPSMTFRPETTYGVTNLWINPDATYIKVKVSYTQNNQEIKETWIVSELIFEDLQIQGLNPVNLGTINGKELIGINVKNPVTKTHVKILPATFIKTDTGTGVVMSVPSHAPYDYMAIKDLNNKNILKKYNLTQEDIPKEFISLINLDGFSKYPAKDICEKMNIKDQNDPKLKEATKEIYKKEFHKGTLNHIFKELEGKKINEVKETLTNQFIKNNHALKYYILPEPVVCRCLTKASVKIIKDQYFLTYSNPEWKKITHELADQIHYYPEDTKQNYHSTIDWLNNWACTRDKGLGTRLPWDKKWLIESLSDSTIYMAYYTIAHYLEHPEKHNIDISQIKPSFFDFIFLNKGDLEEVAKENKITSELLSQIQKEFQYWYNRGFDFRSSGKDLIQNHLTFLMFHHSAIFPKKHWPSGISVNGHLLMDNEKMSKSKGNFITLRDSLNMYGIEASRFTASIAGDVGIDDANFDTRLAKTINRKLLNLIKFAEQNYNKGIDKYRNIDKWLNLKLNEIIEKADIHYNKSETRSALQLAFYETHNILKWYQRRTQKQYHKETINRFIETQALLLYPSISHTSQRILKTINYKNHLNPEWPELKKIDNPEKVILKEELLETLIHDINNIINLFKSKSNKDIEHIELYISKSWKYKQYNLAKNLHSKNKLKSLIKESMQDPELKQNSKESVKYAQQLTKKTIFPEILPKQEELDFLNNNLNFLENELNLKIKIIDSDQSNDPKALRSEPMKPGIKLI